MFTRFLLYLYTFAQRAVSSYFQRFVLPCVLGLNIVSHRVLNAFIRCVCISVRLLQACVLFFDTAFVHAYGLLYWFVRFVHVSYAYKVFTMLYWICTPWLWRPCRPYSLGLDTGIEYVWPPIRILWNRNIHVFNFWSPKASVQGKMRGHLFG